eukprot:3920993-Alexandrium_andersonii.AAC.1
MKRDQAQRVGNPTQEQKQEYARLLGETPPTASTGEADRWAKELNDSMMKAAEVTILTKAPKPKQPWISEGTMEFIVQ